MRYYLQLRWLKAKGELSELDTLINTGLAFSMGVEIAIALVAPYPFLA